MKKINKLEAACYYIVLAPALLFTVLVTLGALYVAIDKGVKFLTDYELHEQFIKPHIKEYINGN